MPRSPVMAFIQESTTMDLFWLNFAPFDTRITMEHTYILAHCKGLSQYRDERNVANLVYVGEYWLRGRNRGEPAFTTGGDGDMTGVMRPTLRCVNPFPHPGDRDNGIVVHTSVRSYTVEAIDSWWVEDMNLPGHIFPGPRAREIDIIENWRF